MTLIVGVTLLGLLVLYLHRQSVKRMREIIEVEKRIDGQLAEMNEQVLDKLGP